MGYEDVEISSRDALRDANGVPIVGSDGRFVTDKGEPRVLAYDVNGIIWDAGVVWKPSVRTQLEAHVGKRYGTTSYYGSFSYAPGSRSSINVSVYDNVAGFGGQVNRVLADLPAKITALEKEIGTIEAALHDPDFYARDAAKFQKAGELLAAKKQALADAEHRWLELEEKAQA